MPLSTWTTFLLASLAATFSPGPGVMTAISTATVAGPARAFFSSAGNASGIFLIAGAAMSGAGLLLQSSPLAFGILKAVGAVYLAYLGVRQWRSVGMSGAAAPGVQRAQVSTRLAAFRRGLLVALSNPKALVFFTAVFPQFMGAPGVGVARFLMLVSTFLICTFISHGFYVGLVAYGGPAVLGAAGMRILGRASALVLMALGGALLMA